MATVFMEAGADHIGTLVNGEWWYSVSLQAGAGVSTEQARTGPRSVKATSGNNLASLIISPLAVLTNAGRVSFGVYFADLPTAELRILYLTNSGGLELFRLMVTSAGVLRCYTGVSTQVGSDGSTLSTGQWYRVCLTWTLTSTSNYTIKVWLDGAVTPDISATNTPTLARIGADNFRWGWTTTNCGVSLAAYFDDWFVDNDNSCTDPGDIHIVHKLPNNTGAENNFDTLVGASASRWTCVSEIPATPDNRWTHVAATQVKENYRIEGADVGALKIGGNTIVSRCAWVSAYQTGAPSGTPAITDNGVDTGITLTTGAPYYYRHITDGATYPDNAAAVGLVSGGTAGKTTHLVECGVLFAVLGAPTPAPTLGNPWYAYAQQ